MDPMSKTPPSDTDKAGSEIYRVSRLLKIAQAIRENPHQSMEDVYHRLGISRSQFYKDKEALAQVGFSFKYSKVKGFTIMEDRLTPITDLSFSDRLVLMFALENLYSNGDGTFAAIAMDAGRKLAGGLPSPFKEHLQQCFDKQVTSGFGASNEVLSKLREALIHGQRLRILYTRSGTWEQRWRVIDPRHIYMRQRTFYLYARTADETPPQWKVFRISRIAEVQYTGVSITWRPDEDDGFYEAQKNAFSAIIGFDPKPITIRFTGQACHFVRERVWHSSQVIEEDGKGGLLFTVNVAEPMEVVRWSRQFGEEAEVVNAEDENEE